MERLWKVKQIISSLSLLIAGVLLQGQGSDSSILGRTVREVGWGEGSMASSNSIVPEGYQQELAPRELDGNPLKVNFSMKVNGILEAENRQTSVILDSFFRVTWKDHRLNYPEGASNDSDGTILHPVILERIWLPDPYIFNVRSVLGVTILKEIQGVLMFRDKTMFISTMLKIELGCSGQFSRYPFDEQECPMNIISYMYTDTDLEMRWLTDGLTVDPQIEENLSNFDFEFLSSNKTECPCYKCIPPVAPCVKANLVLSRKALGHLLATFLPSGLFVAVSWASLFWPAEVIPGRTVLVITALLTLVSMHTGVRQASPETSYVKAVDIWMFMCIMLSILILFEYGIVLFLKKYKPSQPGLTAVQPASLKTSSEKDSLDPSTRTPREERIEKGTRIGIPILFVIFNAVYWPYYLQ